jgi:beta-lactamase class A
MTTAIFINRRRLLFGAALTGAWMRSGTPLFAQTKEARWTSEIGRIEAAVKGRLGVAVIDTGSGVRYGYRADERFPLCSTFKLLAVAALLVRVDAGKESLARRVVFGAQDLVEYSPVTEKHVGGEGMTIAELCTAAITLSDNTAANLILASLGGPGAITAFARSLGDPVTRLDRWETALNEATPGDPRDTTSPASMAANIEKLVLGEVLQPSSKQQLVAWLRANKTGNARLRARLPAGWHVGDKTGSGDRGTTNDAGVIWREDGPPIVVAAYLTETTAPVDERNAALAAVGESLVALAGSSRF